MQLLYPTSIFLFVSILFIILLAGCSGIHVDTTARDSESDALPHLITKLRATTGVNKGILHPNGQLYFSSNTSLHAIDDLEISAKISPPILDPPNLQRLSDLAIDPKSRLVYSLDQYGNAIHVISDTKVITTMLGISEQPRLAVADEDSGEVYVFYTSQTAESALDYIVSLMEVVAAVVPIPF